jgi:hypothetical protein
MNKTEKTNRNMRMIRRFWGFTLSQMPYRALSLECSKGHKGQMKRLLTLELKRRLGLPISESLGKW